MTVMNLKYYKTRKIPRFISILFLLCITLFLITDIPKTNGFSNHRDQQITENKDYINRKYTIKFNFKHTSNSYKDIYYGDIIGLASNISNFSTYVESCSINLIKDFDYENPFFINSSKTTFSNIQTTTDLYCVYLSNIPLSQYINDSSKDSFSLSVTFIKELSFTYLYQLSLFSFRNDFSLFYKENEMINYYYTMKMNVSSAISLYGIPDSNEFNSVLTFNDISISNVRAGNIYDKIVDYDSLEDSELMNKKDALYPNYSFDLKIPFVFNSNENFYFGDELPLNNNASIIINIQSTLIDIKTKNEKSINNYDSISFEYKNTSTATTTSTSNITESNLLLNIIKKKSNTSTNNLINSSNNNNAKNNTSNNISNNSNTITTVFKDSEFISLKLSNFQNNITTKSSFSLTIKDLIALKPTTSVQYKNNFNTNTAIEILVVLNNSNTIISRYTNETENFVINNFSLNNEASFVRHLDNWDIYDHMSWPILFKLKFSHTIINSFIYIDFENYKSGNVIQFMSATCDFSYNSNNNDDVSNKSTFFSNNYGQRPICYNRSPQLPKIPTSTSVSSGTTFLNTSIDDLNQSKIGIYFYIRELQVNKPLYFSVFINALLCGTSLDLSKSDNYFNPKFVVRVYSKDYYSKELFNTMVPSLLSMNSNCYHTEMNNGNATSNTATGADVECSSINSTGCKYYSVYNEHNDFFLDKRKSIPNIGGDYLTEFNNGFLIDNNEEYSNSNSEYKNNNDYLLYHDRSQTNQSLFTESYLNSNNIEDYYNHNNTKNIFSFALSIQKQVGLSKSLGYSFSGPWSSPTDNNTITPYLNTKLELLVNSKYLKVNTTNTNCGLLFANENHTYKSYQTRRNSCNNATNINSECNYLSTSETTEARKLSINNYLKDYYNSISNTNESNSETLSTIIPILKSPNASSPLLSLKTITSTTTRAAFPGAAEYSVLLNLIENYEIEEATNNPILINKSTTIDPNNAVDFGLSTDCFIYKSEKELDYQNRENISKFNYNNNTTIYSYFDFMLNFLNSSNQRIRINRFIRLLPDYGSVFYGKNHNRDDYLSLENEFYFNKNGILSSSSESFSVFHFTNSNIYDDGAANSGAVTRNDEVCILILKGDTLGELSGRGNTVVTVLMNIVMISDVDVKELTDMYLKDKKKNSWYDYSNDNSCEYYYNSDNNNNSSSNENSFYNYNYSCSDYDFSQYYYNNDYILEPTKANIKNHYLNNSYYSNSINSNTNYGNEISNTYLEKTILNTKIVSGDYRKYFGSLLFITNIQTSINDSNNDVVLPVICPDLHNPTDTKTDIAPKIFFFSGESSQHGDFSLSTKIEINGKIFDSYGTRSYSKQAINIEIFNHSYFDNRSDSNSSSYSNYSSYLKNYFGSDSWFSYFGSTIKGMNFDKYYGIELNGLSSTNSYIDAGVFLFSSEFDNDNQDSNNNNDYSLFSSNINSPIFSSFQISSYSSDTTLSQVLENKIKSLTSNEAEPYSSLSLTYQYFGIASINNKSIIKKYYINKKPFSKGVLFYNNSSASKINKTNNKILIEGLPSPSLQQLLSNNNRNNSQNQNIDISFFENNNNYLSNLIYCYFINTKEEKIYTNEESSINTTSSTNIKTETNYNTNFNSNTIIEIKNLVSIRMLKENISNDSSLVLELKIEFPKFCFFIIEINDVITNKSVGSMSFIESYIINTNNQSSKDNNNNDNKFSYYDNIIGSSNLIEENCLTIGTLIVCNSGESYNINSNPNNTNSASSTRNTNNKSNNYKLKLQLSNLTITSKAITSLSITLYQNTKQLFSEFRKTLQEKTIPYSNNTSNTTVASIEEIPTNWLKFFYKKYTKQDSSEIEIQDYSLISLSNNYKFSDFYYLNSSYYKSLGVGVFNLLLENSISYGNVITITGEIGKFLVDSNNYNGVNCYSSFELEELTNQSENSRFINNSKSDNSFYKYYSNNEGDGINNNNNNNNTDLFLDIKLKNSLINSCNVYINSFYPSESYIKVYTKPIHNISYNDYYYSSNNNNNSSYNRINYSSRLYIAIFPIRVLKSSDFTGTFKITLSSYNSMINYINKNTSETIKNEVINLTFPTSSDNKIISDYSINSNSKNSSYQPYYENSLCNMSLYDTTITTITTQSNYQSTSTTTNYFDNYFFFNFSNSVYLIISNRLNPNKYNDTKIKDINAFSINEVTVYLSNNNKSILNNNNNNNNNYSLAIHCRVPETKSPLNCYYNKLTNSVTIKLNSNIKFTTTTTDEEKTKIEIIFSEPIDYLLIEKTRTEINSKSGSRDINYYYYCSLNENLFSSYGYNNSKTVFYSNINLTSFSLSEEGYLNSGIENLFSYSSSNSSNNAISYSTKIDGASVYNNSLKYYLRVTVNKSKLYYENIKKLVSYGKSSNSGSTSITSYSSFFDYFGYYDRSYDYYNSGFYYNTAYTKCDFNYSVYLDKYFGISSSANNSSNLNLIFSGKTLFKIKLDQSYSLQILLPKPTIIIKVIKKSTIIDTTSTYTTTTDVINIQSISYNLNIISIMTDTTFAIDKDFIRFEISIDELFVPFNKDFQSIIDMTVFSISEKLLLRSYQQNTFSENIVYNQDYYSSISSDSGISSNDNSSLTDSSGIISFNSLIMYHKDVFYKNSNKANFVFSNNNSHINNSITHIQLLPGRYKQLKISLTNTSELKHQLEKLNTNIDITISLSEITNTITSLVETKPIMKTREPNYTLNPLLKQSTSLLIGTNCVTKIGKYIATFSQSLSTTYLNSNRNYHKTKIEINSSIFNEFLDSPFKLLIDVTEISKIEKEFVFISLYNYSINSDVSSKIKNKYERKSSSSSSSSDISFYSNEYFNRKDNFYYNRNKIIRSGGDASSSEFCFIPLLGTSRLFFSLSESNVDDIKIRIYDNNNANSKGNVGDSNTSSNSSNNGFSLVEFSNSYFNSNTNNNKNTNDDNGNNKNSEFTFSLSSGSVSINEDIINHNNSNNFHIILRSILNNDSNKTNTNTNDKNNNNINISQYSFNIEITDNSCYSLNYNKLEVYLIDEEYKEDFSSFNIEQSFLYKNATFYNNAHKDNNNDYFSDLPSNKLSISFNIDSNIPTPGNLFCVLYPYNINIQDKPSYTDIRDYFNSNSNSAANNNIDNTVYNYLNNYSNYYDYINNPENKSLNYFIYNTTVINDDYYSSNTYFFDELDYLTQKFNYNNSDIDSESLLYYFTESFYTKSDNLTLLTPGLNRNGLYYLKCIYESSNFYNYHNKNNNFNYNNAESLTNTSSLSTSLSYPNSNYSIIEINDNNVLVDNLETRIGINNIEIVSESSTSDNNVNDKYIPANFGLKVKNNDNNNFCLNLRFSKLPETDTKNYILNMLQRDIINKLDLKNSVTDDDKTKDANCYFIYDNYGNKANNFTSIITNDNSNYTVMNTFSDIDYDVYLKKLNKTQQLSLTKNYNYINKEGSNRYKNRYFNYNYNNIQYFSTSLSNKLLHYKIKETKTNVRNSQFESKNHYYYKKQLKTSFNYQLCIDEIPKCNDIYNKDYFNITEQKEFWLGYVQIGNQTNFISKIEKNITENDEKTIIGIRESFISSNIVDRTKIISNDHITIHNIKFTLIEEFANLSFTVYSKIEMFCVFLLKRQPDIFQIHYNNDNKGDSGNQNEENYDYNKYASFRDENLIVDYETIDDCLKHVFEYYRNTSDYKGYYNSSIGYNGSFLCESFIVDQYERDFYLSVNNDVIRRNGNYDFNYYCFDYIGRYKTKVKNLFTINFGFNSSASNDNTNINANSGNRFMSSNKEADWAI